VENHILITTTEYQSIDIAFTERESINVDGVDIVLADTAILSLHFEGVRINPRQGRKSLSSLKCCQLQELPAVAAASFTCRTVHGIYPPAVTYKDQKTLGQAGGTCRHVGGEATTATYNDEETIGQLMM
jgi:hypothetical protein